MINFLKYTKFYALTSLLVIVVGWGSLIKNGANISIDFTGGSVMHYQTGKSLSEKQVRRVFENQKISVISFDQEKNNTFFIKTKLVTDQQELVLREVIKKEYSTTVNQLKYETVGPTLGNEMMKKTIVASFLAVLIILAYLTFAFKKFNYGVAAVVAMLHDLLVLVGTYSLLSYFMGAEIDTLFVTAVLTTLSFSVHDTIVLFDKIREYRKQTTLPLTTMANKAFTETVVRSINNSLTILLMLVPLTLFGGQSIQFFSAALLIGTVTGMYSSPFVAVPVLVWLENRKK